MSKIRLAEPIETDSIVDGPGLRTVIWLQGCPHHCPGCHNPKTHAYDGGFEKTISEIVDQLNSLNLQDGITFTGGEPLVQAEAMLAILKKIDKTNVWLYSGFSFEEILQMAEKKQSVKELLAYIDVLVDGKFLISQKTLQSKFKGSKNQRIINVPASLARKKIVKKRFRNGEKNKKNKKSVYI